MSPDKEKKHRRLSVSQRTDLFGLPAGKSGERKERHRASSRHEHDVEDPEMTPRLAARVPNQASYDDERSSRRILPPSDGPYGGERDYTIRQESEYSSQNDPISDLTDEFAGVQLESALNPVPSTRYMIEPADRSRQTEEFDPQYSVQEGWRFKFGKVFKILWPEPTGDDGATMNSTYSQRFSKGQSIIQKTRRFVVIKKDVAHCICLPIMTYEGQGTNKRGVKPDDHAMIYTNYRPELLPGERPLLKEDIRVIPLNPQHRLLPASRLCYSKVYTIELNVKVLFIGSVDKDDEWKIVAAYNDVHPPLPPRGKSSHTSSKRHSNSTTGGASNYPSSSHVSSTTHRPGTSSSSTKRGSMHRGSSETGQSTNWQPSQMGGYPDPSYSSRNSQQPPSWPMDNRQYPGVNFAPALSLPQTGTHPSYQHPQSHYMNDDMRQDPYNHPNTYASQGQGQYQEQHSTQSQFSQPQQPQYSYDQLLYQYTTNNASQNYSYQDPRAQNPRAQNSYEDHPTGPPHRCYGIGCLDPSHQTRYS